MGSLAEFSQTTATTDLFGSRVDSSSQPGVSRGNSSTGVSTASTLLQVLQSCYSDPNGSPSPTASFSAVGLTTSVGFMSISGVGVDSSTGSTGEAGLYLDLVSLKLKLRLSIGVVEENENNPCATCEDDNSSASRCSCSWRRIFQKRGRS